MKKCVIVFVLSIVMAASCSLEVKHNPFFDEMAAPALPCDVNADTTVVFVRDYFPEIGRVDTVASNDYEVIRLSKNDMDSVLLVTDDASKKVSLLQVYSEGEKGVIVLKKTSGEGMNVPVMTASDPMYEADCFNVSVENSPANYIVLWQNTALDHKFLTHKRSGSFSVRVPDNAKDFENSCVRIFSYNADGVGKELLVPIHYGKVMLN